MHPQVLKSNNGSGPTGAPTKHDLNTNFDQIFSIFSGVTWWILTSLFFSNSPGSDLSNGVDLVESYTLWKKVMGRSSSLLRDRFGETLEFVENHHFDADLDLRGRIFRRIRVLPHNSQ